MSADRSCSFSTKNSSTAAITQAAMSYFKLVLTAESDTGEHPKKTRRAGQWPGPAALFQQPYLRAGNATTA